ncbi:uncharacterized protein LOC114934547 [Nylanderia fulva]|uniref:uncharacterized protein LOC114934547 n=1 Tax=Nylanderia fulva TaxID=613905 RepID=UPI0010FB93CC|nr:uncharacterized protein LOC114934547 [Nylanderia fulva]
MSEIRHDFWDDIFERQLYESINTHILSTFIQTVENLRKDFSNIMCEFNKIKEQNDNNSKTAIEQIKKEDMLEEVLDITTSTTSGIQQNTGDDVKSEESGFPKFLDELIKEVLENIKKMDLTNREMTDMPRKIEVKTQIDIKYDQFLEIMYQNEIRRIIIQLHDHGKRHFPTGVIDEKKN